MERIPPQRPIRRIHGRGYVRAVRHIPSVIAVSREARTIRAESQRARAITLALFFCADTFSILGCGPAVACPCRFSVAVADVASPSWPMILCIEQVMPDLADDERMTGGRQEGQIPERQSTYSKWYGRLPLPLWSCRSLRCRTRQPPWQIATEKP